MSYNIRARSELSPGIPKLEIQASQQVIPFESMLGWMKMVVRELRQQELKGAEKFIVEFYQPRPPDHIFGLAGKAEDGVTYTCLA